MGGYSGTWLVLLRWSGFRVVMPLSEEVAEEAGGLLWLLLLGLLELSAGVG